MIDYLDAPSPEPKTVPDRHLNVMSEQMKVIEMQTHQ